MCLLRKSQTAQPVEFVLDMERGIFASSSQVREQYACVIQIVF